VITTGPSRGQYLEATGRIDEIDIVDYRPADPGWGSTMSVSQFCDGSGAAQNVPPGPALQPRVCNPGDHTFSGNDLGVAPHVRATSGSYTTPDGPYSQQVTQGNVVAPGTTGAGGLASTLGQTIASAGAGHGLGLVLVDGDLDLWIPIFDAAGHYQSLATFTAA
jgi:hypothetical protein